MVFNQSKLILKLRVPSKSTPGIFHIVEIYESGEMRCDCIAGERKKFCRHKQIILKRLETLIKDIKKQNLNL
jgi:hypothetical protein